MTLFDLCKSLLIDIGPSGCYCNLLIKVAVALHLKMVLKPPAFNWRSNCFTGYRHSWIFKQRNLLDP